MKLAVGIMLTAFGAFWGAEGMGAAWPGGEASLPFLVLALIGCSYWIVARLRAGAGLATPRALGARAVAQLAKPWSFLFGDDVETLVGVGAVLALTALLSTVSTAWYAVPPGVLLLLWYSVRRRALAAGASRA